MEIVENTLSNNPCYKAGKKISVKGLMLHSVGCPQPSAEVFVRKWNNPEEGRACVHAFIDGNTGKVYQTLPWEHRAWHCGGSANNTHIGVEMCEPACLKYTGGSSFTCSDRETAMEVVKRTYDTAVELFAFLCEQYGLDPLENGVIISHKEGHDRGVASGHGDPDHLWKGLQCGYTMDGFREDVKAAMGGAGKGQAATPSQCEPAPGAEEQQGMHDSSTDNKEIHEGDVVMLTPDAVYYSGREIPDWVKIDRWIVKSVNGDRAVIDKNVSGSRAICSPVSVKYLTLVSADQPQVSQAPISGQQTPAQSAASGGEMHISDRGVELVAKFEGCRLEAYQCAAGVWTIGYGHTAGVKPGDKLASQEEAKALLKDDLKKYGDYVNTSVRKGLISFSLNQNQFDALTSFCYNCGNGSLQKLVLGRDAATVAEKMLLYNKGGGKVLAGLTRRREEERALFLS